MYEKEKNLVDHYDNHVKYYSPVKPSTVEEIFRIFGHEPSPSHKVLDLGCGTGWFAYYLDRVHPGIEVTGIDVSKKRIDFAQKANPRLTFMQSDIYEFLKSDKCKKYDLITLWDVLEHLENPNEMLDHAKEHLLPEGKILATVPHNHVYVAHLQVFKSREEVMEKLKPNAIHDWKDLCQYYLCEW